MKKQEFDVIKLNEACNAIRTVCQDLRHFPALQVKAVALMNEICDEYEKQYDELCNKLA